jgi:Cu+-exporting ATPase
LAIRTCYNVRMHRELSTTDEVFQPPKTTGLYALTGLLLFLVGRDLWPEIAAGLSGIGLDLPSGSRELFGIRFALIAAVIGGARTLYGSLDSLFSGKLGADLALAIACIAAIIIGEPLVAAEVVLIGLVGECLESFTFSRTQNALHKLAELFPQRCWLLRDGQEVRVLVKDVQVGNVVVVKPGARIPVDGVVREGRSAVDASALTGESLPVDKGPGDEVLAGCLNQQGALTIEAVRVQQQTVAGQVLDLTAKALKDKAPMERHADRLARWFLPVVLALAALTFVLNVAWYAGPLRSESLRMSIGSAARISVYPTLAALVVACPCALILATPAAIIAALGRLAGTGVLLKSGAALERLAGVQEFAFDKTGTLTEGKIELGDILTLDSSISADEVLRHAAVAEQGSEHPIARVVLHEARKRSLTFESPSEVTALPGAGVRARTAEHEWLVGTQRLLSENGVQVTTEAASLVDKLVSAGQTPLLVALDGKVLGAIGARDRLRPEAYGVLSELRSLGIAKIALLTGDRRVVAEKIGAELGIEQIGAELLPQEKVQAIGDSTAFVGDGINDTPALAKATVGLAIGSGAEVAAEAGDVVLMGDPLRPLPMLVRLARQTVKIIRQNIIIFAFAVNIVGIVVTAWLWPFIATSPGWLEKAPIAGVIYHQLGSLLVLLNSMRLLAFERSSVRASTLRFRSIMNRVDSWIESAGDLDHLLHEAGHRWKPIAAVVCAITLAGYVLSGLTQIEPDEVGIVRRFGAPRSESLSPDLHWRWPWPIETVTRLQPRKVRSVELGFRAVAGKPTADKAALTWTSAHEGEGVLRVGSEAVMPTGDGNLVEILAVAHYRIRDPQRYLLETADPDEILRANLEAVLRESVAAEPFLDLLTVNRHAFQAMVLARLQNRLEPLGLGVEIDEVAMRDMHPPGEVVRSFHMVAQAAEQRDKQIKDAQAESLSTRRRAESESLEN